MFNADNEFEKLNQQVKMEEEKYLNAEVTVENYKFPHIYLTEDEIEEFNKDCEKYGFDIKAVPLTTYMNLNSPDKSLELDEDIDMEQREKDIDRFMDHLGKNFYKKEEKKENELIGKKRNNKVLEDDDEGSNCGSFKSRSYMAKRIENIEQEDKREKSNLSEKIQKGKDDEYKEEKKSNNIKRQKKKIIKKKKNVKADHESEKYENYFRRIRETREKQKEDEDRKDSLVDEIMEKSQLLTQEGLKIIAKAHHIRLLNDNTLLQDDLNKQDVFRLDRIIVDIKINSQVGKLNFDEKENIKKMKDREKAVYENRKLREQKKLQLLNQNKIIHNKEKNDYKSVENKKESDISDDDSDFES